MRHSATGPEAVVCAERRLVDRMSARLRDVIACRCLERAERRFARIERAIDRSVLNGEALYAAAQSMRDLDEIDDEEAACIAQECFEARHDDFLDRDRVYRGILRAVADKSHDELLVELTARDQELAAIFHEARGEARWAAMIRADHASFSEYVVTGQLRLFGSELVPCEELTSIDAPPDPARTAAILERLLGVTAGETIPEVVRALGVLNDVVDDGSARSAVAAFRHALDMGVITKVQHASLVYELAGSWWRTLMETDHEMMRLERRRDAARAASEEALERLEERYTARSDALLAGLFRQLGEFAIAAAYMADPRGFETMASDDCPFVA